MDDKVQNVTVWINKTDHIQEFNGRKVWEDAGYTTVQVFYDCNGLHFVGDGSEKSGEMFIPQTSINRFAVDYFLGHRFKA